MIILPGDNNHSVGASDLYVGGGDGVLLPLLRCLHFIPLPVSVQEEAGPGEKGKSPSEPRVCPQC